VGAAVVDIGGGVQADSGVPMLMGVPAEEPVAEHPGVLDAAEPIGKSGRYFRVLNCASE
jgi:hypothetical protein